MQFWSTLVIIKEIFVSHFVRDVILLWTFWVFPSRIERFRPQESDTQLTLYIYICTYVHMCKDPREKRIISWERLTLIHINISEKAVHIGYIFFLREWERDVRASSNPRGCWMSEGECIWKDLWMCVWEQTSNVRKCVWVDDDFFL